MGDCNNREKSILDADKIRYTQMTAEKSPEFKKITSLVKIFSLEYSLICVNQRSSASN